MVAVQPPPNRVPIVEPGTGRPTLAWIDFIERLWRRTGGNSDNVGASAPPGAVTDFAGSVAPAGWLICDGAAVSRTDLSALFAAIGTTWGAGDGSTTFNLPDLRGVATIGVGTGAGLTARALADTGGAETHALTEAETGPHAHGVTDAGHGHGVTDAGHVHTVTDPGHTHPSAGGGFVDPNGTTEYDNTNADKGSVQANTGSNTTGVTVDSATTGLTVDSGTTGVTVNSAGSGTPHENMMPFAALNKIIKT